MDKRYLTWIELERKAFKKNIEAIKRLAAGRLIAVAVKANAYGHGLKEMVGLLADEKIDYIAVHTIDEALIARKYGWSRNVLIVGYSPIFDLTAIFEYDLQPTVYNIETLKQLGRLSEKLNKEVAIHLKVETGTHRQGVDEAKLPAFIELIKKYKKVKLLGVSTHFANIEDTTDHSFANSQLIEFNRLAAIILKNGLRPQILHTACSAALLLFEETRLDMVRPGIALYGYWPSKETYLSYRLDGGSNHILKPILTWKTRIAQIKNVEKDQFIGYGCTYKTTTRTKLAILPVGYYDGYDRALSNLGYVLINGQRAPIRGRVCMNLMMADITDIKNIHLEDEVILLGKSGHDSISADLMADWSQTVNYEILSRINHNIKKIIV
ncbi:MAG: alanine racemase [Candidatus Zixiibacteriota bacterium]